jgi:hypothetical protein
MILGNHSEVASLGEFSFLGKALALHQDCSCGTPVVSCEHWTRVFDRVLEERKVFLPHTPYAMEQWDTAASVVIDREHQTTGYLLGKKARSLWCDIRYGLKGRIPIALPLPGRLRKGADNALYLYDVVREVWRKGMVVDSSKNVHKALAVYERAPSETRIIFLVRDGRGVFCSRLRSGFSARESIRGWMSYNKRATNLLARIPSRGHVIQLKYEDLATDTERVISELMQFLALRYERGMSELRCKEYHLVDGNNVRFQKAIKISLDERWRRELDARQLAYFDRTCGRQNRKFGYV